MIMMIPKIDINPIQIGDNRRLDSKVNPFVRQTIAYLYKSNIGNLTKIAQFLQFEGLRLSYAMVRIIAHEYDFDELTEQQRCQIKGRFYEFEYEQAKKNVKQKKQRLEEFINSQ